MDVHNTIGGSLQISTEVIAKKLRVWPRWRLTVLPM